MGTFIDEFYRPCGLALEASRYTMGLYYEMKNWMMGKLKNPQTVFGGSFNMIAP
jgi:hypothetical protein